MKNLTAKEQEILKAKEALSAVEIAQMQDFKVKINKEEVIDFTEMVDLYPDPNLSLDLQVDDDDK